LAETNLSFDVLKNKKIVVADDNIHNRLVASIIIKNRGAVVFEAENGKEAIQLAVDKNADLILMDIQMPVLNGYEASKMLREREFISPIIALTANAIKGEKEKCIEAGMDDYIAKPFTENELLKTVSIWLDQKPNPDLKPVENKTIRPELEERLYDISTLKSISRDNDIFIRKMVNLFCEQTPPLLEEMKNAYRNNDLKTMGALAHRIKPSLDNLHIHSLKQDIRLIENAGKENNALPNLSELILRTEQILKQVIQNMKTDYP
jgi:CheY-like chemotaxis protein